jgi:hypothetical protein
MNHEIWQDPAMRPRQDVEKNVGVSARSNCCAVSAHEPEHHGEQQGMWTRAQVVAHIGFLQRRIAVFTTYRDECIAIGTRHGVIDAECDMREFDAQIAVLREVLQEEAPGPRVCG